MSEPVAQQPNYPEFLEELSAKIAAFLVDRGFDATLAQELGADCAEYVRRDWGGQRIYIPTGKEFELGQRDRDLAARWNGRNTRELCIEFRITETHLRRVVAAFRAQEAKRRQTDLIWEGKVLPRPPPAADSSRASPVPALFKGVALLEIGATICRWDGGGTWMMESYLRKSWRSTRRGKTRGTAACSSPFR